MKLQELVDTRIVQNHLTDLRKTLEALAARERILQETLRPVHEAWLAVRKEYVEKSFGCAVGDVVLDRHLQPHRVYGIDRYRNYDKPWLVVNPLKRNGEWSMVKRHLYSDWTPKP
jgi:hypothetical protein